MARYQMSISNIYQLWFILVASLFAETAASAETTAFRWIDRARYVSFQNNTLAFFHIQSWNRDR